MGGKKKELEKRYKERVRIKKRRKKMMKKKKRRKKKEENEKKGGICLNLYTFGKDT